MHDHFLAEITRFSRVSSYAMNHKPGHPAPTTSKIKKLRLGGQWSIVLLGSMDDIAAKFATFSKRRPPIRPDKHPLKRRIGEPWQLDPIHHGVIHGSEQQVQPPVRSQLARNLVQHVSTCPYLALLRRLLR